MACRREGFGLGFGKHKSVLAGPVGAGQLTDLASNPEPARTFPLLFVLWIDFCLALPRQAWVPGTASGAPDSWLVGNSFKR